jgi:threonine dehydrogenase-like Zn-dependent dehydrogenase
MSTITARRAVLVGAQQPIEVWERPVPPPGPAEVRVRVTHGGVCGTDVHLWRGEMPLPGPVVLGHEGLGEVEALGEGIGTDSAGQALQPGDRVYWQPVAPCQRCYACTVLGDVSMCENGFAAVFRGADGPTAASYCDYATLGANLPFYRVPEDTPSDAVIALGCALPTMLQGMERLGGLHTGQSVVVQGCGPVGLAATWLAHLAGAHPVITVGAPAHRLAMARRFGATDVVDMQAVPDAAERARIVRERTGGRGADVVIEAAGALPAFAEGMGLVARAGRYLIVGLWSAPGTVPIEPRLINNLNLRLIGTALSQPRHLYQAVELVRAHHARYPLAEVVTHRYGVQDSQRALEAVARLETIKAVIAPAA